MTGKNVSLSEENEERVYYVEDVDGDDFTFYLRLRDQDQKHLLPPETLSQDGQELPGKRRFSYSTNIQVVKISPHLTVSDVIENGDPLLRELAAALTTPNTRSEAKAAWTALIETFPGELKTEITGIQNYTEGEETRADLLQKILKKLNDLLDTEDLTQLLGDHSSVLEETELRSIVKFSELGQKAYQNRKRFDRHFGSAFKPLRTQLEPIAGRALTCRSYRDQLLSVSFRTKLSKSSYKPDDSDKYAVSMEKYCVEVFSAIFMSDSTKGATGGEQSAKRGLLVISGATNSSKSEIATGLIYKYLETQKSRTRWPHLVTFEDPIEKFYVEEAEIPDASFRCVKMPAGRDGIDYTPREKGNTDEKGRDVRSLKEAFSDALRQTPTVFFVGETRDKEDWEQLIDFAGTGHLIVTTAHAGALTEAMRKIFEALKVKTPAERNEIANRLLGIVHIRRHDDTNILVPAIWRRTPSGTRTLTAEGLSSLLPYKPAMGNVSLTEVGCLGRAWFAEQLVKDPSKLRPKQKEALKRKALEWDLEGV